MEAPSQPDWNAAEGEPGHIFNKPFGTETTPDFVFTADDIANPIERIENPDLEGMAYVKVSDRVFTADELDGMSVTYISGDDNLEPVTTTELFIDKDHTFLPTGIMFSSMNDGTAFGVVIEQETNMGFRLSTGLWLIDYGSIIGNTKILSVTIPGSETVHPIPEKYLPEHLQFGETTVKGDTLTWDGNTEGLASVDLGGASMYHVSDIVPEIEAFSNGYSFSILQEGQIETAELTAEDYADIKDIFAEYGFIMPAEQIYIIPSDNFNMPGLGQVFPQKGVYFMGMGDVMRVASLTIPGYTGFESTTVKTLDEKFMPILTSPNGTKYKLAVSDDGTLAAEIVN